MAKKANVQMLTGAVITLVVLGVLIAVALVVLNNMSGNMLYDVKVTGETICLNNGNYSQFAHSLVTTTSVSAMNATTFKVLSSNYLQYDNEGAYKATKVGLTVAGGSAGYNNTCKLFNYTYGTRNTAGQAIDTGAGAIGNMTSWLGIIIVVLVSGVIIYLVTQSMVGRR